jgi:hypothetical protein
MRLHPVPIATAALLLLSCNREQDSYIVIHSDVNCDVPRVFQLRVTITNDGVVDQKLLPETPSAELGFPSSITLVVGGSHSGSVDLVVEALDNNYHLIGQGNVGGILDPGGRIDLTVQLAATAITGPTPGVQLSQGVDGGGQALDGGASVSSIAPGGSGVSFAQVAVCQRSTCAVRTDASLWCWGENKYGELRSSSETSFSLTPLAVSGTGWATVACGQTDACGIRTDGTLSCWGNNGSGQLAGGTTGADHQQVDVPDGPWQSIAPGSFQTCGIKTDATLWCWGDNSNGQLGTGNVEAKTAPTQVTGTGWSQVSTSYYHTCAVKQDGTLWCWGLNANMQLADPTVSSFRMLPGQLNGTDYWTQVVTGEYHTCAIRQDKSLWCWGGNTAGQLGNASVPLLAQGVQGGTSDRVQVTGAGAGTWNSIAAGGVHTCGIMSDQSLWCWGDNTYGQLGIGSEVAASTPVAVGAPGQTWASVAAGLLNTCALATDGSLWCWGSNSDGQLGLGSNDGRQVPTRVVQ